MTDLIICTITLIWSQFVNNIGTIIPYSLLHKRPATIKSFNIYSGFWNLPPFLKHKNPNKPLLAMHSNTNMENILEAFDDVCKLNIFASVGSVYS